MVTADDDNDADVDEGDTKLWRTVSLSMGDENGEMMVFGVVVVGITMESSILQEVGGGEEVQDGKDDNPISMVVLLLLLLLMMRVSTSASLASLSIVLLFLPLPLLLLVGPIFVLLEMNIDP